MEYRKILYKKEPSSSTTWGWTAHKSREEAIKAQIQSHRNWVVLSVKSVPSKKGY